MVGGFGGVTTVAAWDQDRRFRSSATLRVTTRLRQPDTDSKHFQVLSLVKSMAADEI